MTKDNPITTPEDDLPRVLVQGRDNLAENGVYDVQPDGTLTRSADYIGPDGEWIAHSSGSSLDGAIVRFTTAPDYSAHRRPGARTLGAWRRKVLAPADILAALVGGGSARGLTPETAAACLTLGRQIVREIGEPQTPDAERAPDHRMWTHPSLTAASP